MKKKLIALLVLFNSNLIINSYTAVNKQASDQKIFDDKIAVLADLDTPIIEFTINAFIAQITISTMSDGDKQAYFEKLSETLAERDLPKTVEEIQAISKKYAQEGTQKDINLLMDRLSPVGLTETDFDKILQDFNKTELAVARLVTDQNVIAKTQTLLDTIKDVGDKNSWSYDSIYGKEQEFLQKTKTLAKAEEILKINYQKFNLGEINQSEFITRVTSLLRDWKEEGILENLKKTSEYNDFIEQYKKEKKALKEVEDAKVAQAEAAKLIANFQKRQQQQKDDADLQQSNIEAAKLQQSNITAAAKKIEADSTQALISTELKLKEIAIQKSFNTILNADDQAFYDKNKSKIDDLIVKLNGIKAKIVAGEAPNKMQEYQVFFPARVFGDGTDGKIFKEEFISKVGELLILKIKQDGKNAGSIAVSQRATAAKAQEAKSAADRAAAAALAQQVQAEQQQQKTEQARKEDETLREQQQQERERLEAAERAEARE